MINDNGGTKQASDINVSFVNASNPSPDSFPGDEGGTTVTMDAGNYELSTNDPGPGYSGFTNDPDCSPGPIANGETKHCTINFDDKPGTLKVDKVVVNDNGGTSKATDFKFSVNNGARSRSTPEPTTSTAARASPSTPAPTPSAKTPAPATRPTTTTAQASTSTTTRPSPARSPTTTSRPS